MSDVEQNCETLFFFLQCDSHMMEFNPNVKKYIKKFQKRVNYKYILNIGVYHI